MLSRSRSRRSSRSGQKSSSMSVSIPERDGQSPSQDEHNCASQDEMELVPCTSQSEIHDITHSSHIGSSHTGGAPSDPADGVPSPVEVDDPGEPLDEEELGTRMDPGTTGSRQRFPHKRFGLHTNPIFTAQGAPMNYKQKYPEDQTYKEIDPDARVFLIYNDESQTFDNEMVLEAGDSLDILLVFAGLFSAVLTTFVVQTSQALSPDKIDTSNSLLREMISLQRAQANGTSLDSIPSADTSFTSSRSDIWVNGLRFISLTLSLSTALIAVLAKQWLRQYSSFISGSARTRALIRQFRYDGLEKWGVRLIIGLLPTILHISLFLFMAGLVVFLLPLNNVLAPIVAVIAGFLCATYITTNILPIIFVQCPYRTPFAEIFFAVSKSLIKSVAYAFNSTIATPVERALEALGCWKLSEWIPVWHYSLPESLKEAERIFADNARYIGAAMAWLACTTSDLSAKAIVAEAVGALPFVLELDLHKAINHQWKSTPCIHAGDSLAAEDERALERLIRSIFMVKAHLDFPFMLEGMRTKLPREPINAQAQATVLAIAICGRTSRFHVAQGQWEILESHLVFNFVIGRYPMWAEFEAPTWVWWSICGQAARGWVEERHVDVLYKFITDGSSLAIPARYGPYPKREPFHNGLGAFQ